MTANQAADRLGYIVHHVYKLLRSGTIKAERILQTWMINPAEVERVKALQGPGGRLLRSSPQRLEGEEPASN